MDSIIYNYFLMKSILKTSLIIIFSFLLILLSSCSKNNKEYHQHIENAEKLLKNKNYTKAKTEYLKAFALQKEDKTLAKKISEIDALILKQNDSLYHVLVLKGDELYNNHLLEEAKQYYTKAKKYKPEETYPDIMLKNIFEKSTSLKENSTLKMPYQVIVGSFKIAENAEKLRKKLAVKYPTTHILTNRWNGNYLVSIKSFSNIHQAYNFMYVEDENFKDDINEDDDVIWVYKE